MKLCRVAFLLVSVPAFGQGVVIFDIAADPVVGVVSSGEGYALGSLDGRALFGLFSPASGNEPWVLDANEGPPHLLKDLRTGPGSSDPQCGLRVGSEVAFMASPSAGVGSHWWFTDGTAAGTSWVGAPLGQDEPSGFGHCRGAVLDDSSVVRPALFDDVPGLWKFVPGGSPQLLWTMEPSEFFDQTQFLETPGRVLFSYCTQDTGCEPWSTDGTPEGTGPLADLAPGPDASSPSNWVHAGSRAIFRARAQPLQERWWQLDLASLEIAELAVGQPGEGPSWVTEAVVCGGQVVFAATDSGGWGQLWRFELDDPVATLQQVAFSSQSLTGPEHLVCLGPRVIFLMAVLPYDAVPHALVLGNGQVELLADVVAEPDYQQGFVRSGNRVAFRGRTAAAGREPWVSDGTIPGTLILADLEPGSGDSNPYGFVALGGGFAFLVTAADGKVEFYRESPGGAELAGRVGFDSHSSSPSVVDVVGGRILASGRASGQSSDRSLWLLESADPTAIEWITDGQSDLSSFAAIGRLRGHAYFLRHPPAGEPIEIWRSDGTVAGTQPLDSPSAQPSHQNPPPVRVRGGLVLRSCDPGTGCEPYRIDVAGESHLVSDVLEGAGSGWGTGTASGRPGWFYFPGFDPTTGEEPWVSDGSAAGTRPLADLEPGSMSTTPRCFAAAKSGALFRVHENAGAGRALYLHSLGEEPPVRLTGLGQTVFDICGAIVSTREGEAGMVVRELDGSYRIWITDGTLIGTRRLIEPWPEDLSVHWRALARVGSQWYFLHETPETGLELWTSNGTLTGTRLVRDIYAGPASSMIGSLVSGPDHVYFAASDGIHGLELWRSDGTAEGTEMVVDLDPGTPGTNPEDIRWVGDWLLWRVTSPVHGIELAAMSLIGPDILRDDFETGDTLEWAPPP